MALDMQERHAFEHEEGRSPVWIGMAWGAVHSRISTTQIYAKVTDDKIDMDTRSLEEKIAGRFSVAI